MPAIDQSDSQQRLLSKLNVTVDPIDIDLVFAKVERAKQEWEATVDSLPELVCVIDEQGLVVRANRTIERWNIGNVTSLQGFSLHTLLHPGCLALYCGLDRYLRQAAESIKAGSVVPYEAYDTFLNRHLRVRVQPVNSRQPDLPITAVIVFEDITEHRHNEQALHRSMTRLAAMNDIQRSILAARSPEEIVKAALTRLRPLVTFRQARVTLCNTTSELTVFVADFKGTTRLHPGQTQPATELQFDRHHDLTVDFCIDDLLEVDYPSPLQWQLVSEGLRSIVNFPLIADDEFIGSLLLASDRVAAFQPDQLEAAREISNLLAIAVHQARLYRQLQQTNVQLRSALRAKEEMIANVSHELRTPLGVIYGYAQLLADGGLGLLTAEQHQATQLMCDQSERLRSMINRLVRLAGLDKTTLPCVPMNLIDWLPPVLDRWRSRLAGSKLQLELDLAASQLPVLGSPDYLREVIDNLIDNAVKFSPRGGALRVRAWQEENRAIISIADDGIGILADSLTQVFERFHQLDGSSTRQFGGMGIGLALCHGIVSMHGGHIWAESASPAQGSTFYVALPLTEPDTEAD